MDYDDEVLYVYEIQIDPSYQRKGIGRFMMFALEMLAFKADMRKIMLTVFKHNPEADKFFKNTMKYEIDETCPIDDVVEQYDYEILSKFNKRKLAREAAEAPKEEHGCQKKCCWKTRTHRSHIFKFFSIIDYTLKYNFSQYFQVYFNP